MSLARFFRLYAAAIVTMMILDGIWIGIIAKPFYAAQMGHLTRPDVQWLPALAFYLVYAGAVVELAVKPALTQRSFGRGVALGALLGLAAYGAFDFTLLAMFKDFPVTGGMVDLAWGTFVTATVSGATSLVGGVRRPA